MFSVQVFGIFNNSKYKAMSYDDIVQYSCDFSTPIEKSRARAVQDLAKHRACFRVSRKQPDQNTIDHK